MTRSVTIDFADGSSHTYDNVPDKIDQSGVEARAAKDFPDRQIKAAAPPPPSPPAPQGVDIGQAIGAGPWGPGAEAALSLGSGALAWPAGLLAGGYKLATTGDLDKAVAARHGAEEAVTYQPRTERGQQIADVASYPFRKIGEFGDWTGEKVMSGLQKIGVPERIAATAGGITSEAVPWVVPEAGGRVVKHAPRAWEVARGPKPAPPPGGGLSPQAQARVQRWADLDVPIRGTKGQAERDPAQIRRERQLAQTDVGKEINLRDQEVNERLDQNIDVLLGRVKSPKERAPTDVGRIVTDETLKKHAEASARAVDAAYNAARTAGEMAERIDVTPLSDFLNNHVNPGMVDYVQGYLLKKKLIKDDGAGSWVPTGKFTESARDITAPETVKMREGFGRISLNELDEIYKAASAAARAGGERGFYAGEVKQIINQMTENAGGELYKKAHRDRAIHAMRYENRASMARLIENKPRSTDPVTALEDVYDAGVLKTKVAELQNLKREILLGKGAEPGAGRRAWREIQGQTIRWIRDFSEGALDERGKRELGAARMKRALDRLGDEKIDVIFSPGTARRLRNIVQSAEELKTAPDPRIRGSDTAANALNWLTRTSNLVGKIPGIGGPLRGALGSYERWAEKGQMAGEVEEALMNQRPPGKTAQQFADAIAPAVKWALSPTPFLAHRKTDDDQTR